MTESLLVEQGREGQRKACRKGGWAVGPCLCGRGEREECVMGLHVPDGEKDWHLGVRGWGLPGPCFLPLVARSHQDDSVLWSLTACGSASCSTPTPPAPPSPSHRLLGIFWLDWMEGDLGTYQLARMSCLSFFF